MTDIEFGNLMVDMSHGNRDALRKIYEEYVKLIYSVVYDTIRNKQEAEDITSEFFIKLYNISGNYNAGNGHKKWLVTIAKNMTIDRIRKLDREMLVDEFPEKAAPQSSLEDSVSLNETVKAAMAYLKQEEKEVLDLKIVGEFTFKEISEMLEKPQGTISWLYNNALKKLRRCQEWN